MPGTDVSKEPHLRDPIRFKFGYFYFMCIGVLPALYLYEDVRIPGTEVSDSCELPWELNPGFSGRTTSALNL